MKKVCTKCGNEYPATVEYFYGHKRGKDGLRERCKRCYVAGNAERNRVWRDRNREHIGKYNKKWYESHAEYSRECQREYHGTLRGHVSRLVGHIRDRCSNPGNKSYGCYGGRGGRGGRGVRCLFTSQELYDWLIENGIDPRGLHTHRVDNEGDYTLDNIRFLCPDEHKKLHDALMVVA